MSVQHGDDRSTRTRTSHASFLGRATDTLARIPLPAVAAMLIVGAVLDGLQSTWIASIVAAGAEEPPQWLARLTVMQVNVLVPVALLAMWARRRGPQGRLGATAAAMLALTPLTHVFLTVGAILWGGLLARGDMTYPFMWIEVLVFVGYLGALIGTIAWMRDRGAPRLVGPLIALGITISFVVPWAMAAIYTVLAFVVIRTRLSRIDSSEARAASVS